MRKVLPVFGLLAIALGFYSVWRSTATKPNGSDSTSAVATAEPSKGSSLVPRTSPPTSGTPAVPTPKQADSPASTSNSSPVTPPQVEPLPAELASMSPETTLENMRTTIRQYGAMFAGNPVGTNPEITQALGGENPKHINFLKADGNRVNSRGELVDSWGTPYFFHQISGSEMEIRSAGPDKVMYTGDDLVIR